MDLGAAPAYQMRSTIAFPKLNPASTIQQRRSGNSRRHHSVLADVIFGVHDVIGLLEGATSDFEAVASSETRAIKSENVMINISRRNVLAADRDSCQPLCQRVLSVSIEPLATRLVEKLRAE